MITSRLSTALADRYRIERHLGEGGMATVYVAHDLKHDRKVAVKVLRPALAAVLGAERFVHEIKTTANLQHPHILPLFNSGEDDGFLYYVMPFIDGETLRDKLNRETQLGIEEAVRITTDVADALDYAHRQGVIHRDIKPENILLHDGRPMVADFGIALAVSAAAGGRMTETGLSLGTPHYMSPEQATAEKDLTNRSDIYSLGAVLYEMLTGEPPHTGGSAQAIVMKIVTDEVRPVTELRKSVPPHVAASTAKALEKLAADRFATAKEFAEALTNPAFTLPTTEAAAVTDALASGPWKRLTIGVTAVAAILLLTTGWGWLRPAPEPPRPVTRVSVRLPADQARVANSFFDVSADGRLLVYGGPGAPEGPVQLWARRWNALYATPLRDTEGATNFAISPNGEEVALSIGSSIRVVPIGDGVTRTVVPDSAACCPRWSPDGDRIYFTHLRGPVSRVPAAGGPVAVLSQVDTLAGDLGHQWVDVLPGDQGIVFEAAQLFGARPRIMAMNLESGDVRELVAGRYPRYGGGRLFFADADGTTLMSAPFNVARLEMTGAPAPVAERLSAVVAGSSILMASARWALYSLSQTGTLVYSTGAPASAPIPVWVDRDGTTRRIAADWQGNYNTPSISPDGTRLVVGRGTAEVLVKQLDDGPLTSVSFGGSINYRPTWTPDGESVVFASNREGTSESDIAMYSARADGSGDIEAMNINIVSPSAFWSRDGQWLVYRTSNLAADRGNLMAIRPGRDTVPVALVATEFMESQAALSPDGRWLAYSSDRSGRREVYVRPFPNASDSRASISTDGGTSPAWAHSGRELFYKNVANELVVVTFDTTPSFAVRSRTTLFSTQGFLGASISPRDYDITPDDRRFVMIQLPDPNARDVQELILVENLFEELKARGGRE